MVIVYLDISMSTNYVLTVCLLKVNGVLLLALNYILFPMQDWNDPAIRQ